MAGKGQDAEPSPTLSSHNTAHGAATQPWRPKSHRLLVGTVPHLFSLTLDSPVNPDAGTVSL